MKIGYLGSVTFYAVKIRGFFEKTNPVNDGALAFNEYALDASGNLVYMNNKGGNEQHIVNYGKWYADNGSYFKATSFFVVDAKNFASLSALTSTLAGLSGGATTNWGDVRDGSITTLAGSLSVIGGIAAIATGVGTPAGVAGISFGVPTIGFGIAKILDGFQGGARTIPGGLFEATDIGFGGNGNLGQMGDIFSSGLPKNVTDGFIMGYGFYNSNIGQSFFYNPTINSSHSSFPPLIIQKDNTNVVLPIIR